MNGPNNAEEDNRNTPDGGDNGERGGGEFESIARCTASVKVSGGAVWASIRAVLLQSSTATARHVRKRLVDTVGMADMATC